MAPAATHSESPRPIILIDGVCVLCSRWYRFVTARDKAHCFRFVAIQEDEGRAIAEAHGIDPNDPTTFILVDGGVAIFRSEAGLRILEQLPGWRWTRILHAIPRGLRDWLYNLVARNRYRWFGRLDVCVLPNAPRTNR